jgi:hypothetical protein
MNYLSPIAARAIVADMPPPPGYHDSNQRHSAEAWEYLLIICAICAAAFVGLWRLFRRRSKDSMPKAKASDEAMNRQTTVPENPQTEPPGRNGEVTKII